MRSSAFTVCVQLASGLIKISGVVKVELETLQDDTGRGVFFYALYNDMNEEIAHFPFNMVSGWWRQQELRNSQAVDHQLMAADAL